MTDWWEAMVFLTKSDSGDDEAIAETLAADTIVVILILNVAAMDTNSRLQLCNQLLSIRLQMSAIKFVLQPN